MEFKRIEESGGQGRSLILGTGRLTGAQNNHFFHFSHHHRQGNIIFFARGVKKKGQAVFPDLGLEINAPIFGSDNCSSILCNPRTSHFLTAYFFESLKNF